MAGKVRVGLVGGGAESFMGPIHLAAIEQSGEVEVVCGALASTRHGAFTAGRQLGIPTSRSYGIYRDMFRREVVLPEYERMEFASVIAPNGMHYPISMSAADAGFPLLCEKPFACSLPEALNLARKLQERSLLHGVAFTFGGYPMLLCAQKLIQTDRTIGNVRRVITTSLVGWMAQRLETAGNKQALWRTDQRRCGPVGCLMDLGLECFHLTEWLTGLHVSEICADLKTNVAGRILDDDASVLVRFEEGGRGTFICSQVAAGYQEGVTIEVYGEKGSVRWSQSAPDRLVLRDLSLAEEVYTGGLPAAERGPQAQQPYGDNDAYIAALAETYRSFAAHVRNPGVADANPAFANIEQGLRSIAFIDAAIRNVTALGEGLPHLKWTPFVLPPVPEL
ncbi:MAG: Gfo/Idh/MocA family oxidoreductase [Kiritimatiellaeota bacterium]|nr:Gfo/Idh/MocA family oxidoreductase [Kiritimatiellota bacterium]